MKKILMIAPQFYGYETVIFDNLSKLGYDVYYINPSIDEKNILLKIIYKYIKKFNSSIDKFYYNSRLRQVPNEIDEVFVIYTHYITEPIIAKIKEKYPSCRHILYFWDSICNNPAALQVTKYFDKILTFDPSDSERFGWKYRPLFYIKDYLVNKERDVDVTFIGSVHSNRIDIANKLRYFCREKNLSSYIALYSKKIIFYFKKYIKKNTKYKVADAKNFSFRRLSLKETYRIYGKSKIVIDYVYPNQIGLTMRTIEALGSGCLLITNNSNIKKEQVYDPNIIFVYEGEDLEIPQEFLQYKGRRDELISLDYSLDKWIEEVFH